MFCLAFLDIIKVTMFTPKTLIFSNRIFVFFIAVDRHFILKLLLFSLTTTDNLILNDIFKRFVDYAS